MPVTKNSSVPLRSSSAEVAPVMIGSRPTLLIHGGMKFLIMDAPRHSNLHLYIREMRNHGITDVVRVCEATYLANDLQSAGITLHEMPYDDGHSPPRGILDKWLQVVERLFFLSPHPNNNAIAVHCVAGLGRAPVLVAIALVEFANMDPVEAVSLIRKSRRGAINQQQLNWLEQYRRSYKRTGAGDTCCVIS